MTLIFVLLSVLVISAAAASEDDSSEAAAIEYRLPRNIVPRHYNINLRTEAHTGNRSYNGSVDIWMRVAMPTDQVVLNSVNLTIQRYRLYRLVDGVDPVELTDLKQSSDTNNEWIVVNVTESLAIGEYMLSIDFNGTADDTANAIFMSSYFDEAGTEHHFLASHFAPTSMRQAIPSFDEPAFKATFNLTIVHHRGYTAYSNMPLVKPPEMYLFNRNYLISTFQQTPRMSTYLIALAVVDFTTQSLGNHTAVARPSESYGLGFSLELAQEVTDFLGKHTGLKYDDIMPKQTHLLIPQMEENSWGAMENWGLVIYEEDTFLYAPSKNTSEQLLNAMKTVTHEMAHHWFGNLVSPEWWSDIWLTEGFATLYSYYALHLMRPDERWMDYFKVKAMGWGLVDTEMMPQITCSLAGRKPISECYNLIVYEKTAGVLNMFRELVGNATWHRIVRRLLRDHQLGNVVPEDLYALITEETSTKRHLFPEDMSVGAIFDTWLSKPGTPLLRIRRLKSAGQFIISQQRSIPCTMEDDEPWIIPYSYTYESEANFEDIGPVHWLTTPAALITINVANDEWIVFNKLRFGAYRVNYDDHDWRLIIRALQENASCIHMQTKAQLLADAYTLTMDDMLPFDLLLELLTYLRNETDLLLWISGDGILKDVYEIHMKYTDYYNQFRVVHLHLMEHVYEILPSSPAALSPAERKAFYQITSNACFLGSEKCLHEAEIAFVKSAESNTAVLPDELYVYCYGQRNASESQFAWLVELFRADQHLSTKLNLMTKLLCANQVDRLRKVIIAIDEWFSRTKSERDRIEIMDRMEETLISRVVPKQLYIFVQIMSDGALIDRLNAVVIENVLNSMQKLAKLEHDFEQWDEFNAKMSNKFVAKKVDLSLNVKRKSRKVSLLQLQVVIFIEQYCNQWNIACNRTG